MVVVETGYAEHLRRQGQPQQFQDVLYKSPTLSMMDADKDEILRGQNLLPGNKELMRSGSLGSSTNYEAKW